jgi:ABC-2 type transport system permease protein
MRNVLLIIRREFLERVRTRSFVLSTLLFPLFMAALIFIPSLMKSGGGERTLVLVDQSPAGIGQSVVQAMQAPREDKDAIRYTIEHIEGPLEPQRARLNARVEAREIDGYLWIAPDVVTTSEVQYRARDVTRLQVVQDIEQAVTAAVRQERLRGQGLTAAQVAQLVRGVDVKASRITGGGEEGGNVGATLITAYIIGIMFMQLILLYGQNAMRSVLEEKNNRIVEVIVSSVHATQLMAGKVLGLAAVAVLQVGIWVGFSMLMTSQGARLGMSAGALRAAALGPAVWGTILVYFILGFILYAAMYAAAGSTVTSEQEAQQLTFPLMIPLIVPMLFIIPVLTDPLGSTARTLSLIPFTSPVVMPMRAVATEIPPLETAASIALLIVGVLGVLWLAGKIYRVGILSTGKKPTLRELGRWLRAA